MMIIENCYNSRGALFVGNFLSDQFEQLFQTGWLMPLQHSSSQLFNSGFT